VAAAQCWSIGTFYARPVISTLALPTSLMPVSTKNMKQ
jgi:hypothetical protein